MPGRIGYWAVAMGGNWLVCGSIMMLILVIAGGHSIRRRVLVTAAAAPVAAAPGTGVVLAAEALFRPGYAEPVGVPTIYLSVAVLMLVIGLAVVAVMEVRRGLAERSVAGPAPEEAGESGTRAGPAPGARFLDRLPEKLGRDLVYLKTADHYVEAVTTAGSTLVLMRFVDAVSRARRRGRAQGAPLILGRAPPCGRAPRARKAVPRLRLTGGHEVPVSRTYMAAARAAGLV